VAILLEKCDVLSFSRHALSQMAKKYQVPGAQLAIRHEGETVAIEVGELEHRTGRRVTRDAAFPIGSISKSFTATLAMTLVADGDIELDAPVGDHLPELDGLGAELTLRHLLSHTGGLICGPYSEDVATTSLRRYVVEHCHRQNLVLPPGTGFSYSNMGYVLVGRLIEAITGMSWREAIASIVLRPLGIDPAFICDLAPTMPQRPVATGHSVNTVVGRTRPVHQALAPVEAPAGGLAVSAVDLVALGLLHAGSGAPELLPAPFAAQMRQAAPTADPFGLADGWGLGLAVFGGGPADWIGHDGNADGTSCHLRINPADGWVIAFTSNANTGFAMWQELLGELARAGTPIGAPRAWAQGPPAPAPQGCAGTYANGDVEYVVTAAKDGQFHLVIDGDAARLTFHAGLTFSMVDPASGQQAFGGRVVRDRTTGKVDGIQVGGRLARRRIRGARGIRDTGRRLIA
jgi:CubicO group peptidase (beta-lactamase class C family)